jgi:2-hydroxychromene-2-carboxylate isomerase
MTEPIEFFFDLVSPFGWFAAERVGGRTLTQGPWPGGRCCSG